MGITSKSSAADSWTIFFIKTTVLHINGNVCLYSVGTIKIKQDVFHVLQMYSIRKNSLIQRVSSDDRTNHMQRCRKTKQSISLCKVPLAENKQIRCSC